MVMLRGKNKKYGQSIVEFTILILFILAVLVVFQKYIVRGLSGRWKSVGDTIGQGRLYDPNKTDECRYFTFFQGEPAKWFEQTCFEDGCEGPCLHSGKNAAACSTCLDSCLKTCSGSGED
jgi:hypothetical protein